MPVKLPSALSDSWTDDIQTCSQTGIGISTNVIYRHNGQPVQEHPMENTFIRYKYDDNICLYGVFDGHDCSTVAEYASQKMSAELLLDQLHSEMTDEEVKRLLCRAFAVVEQDYFTTIGDKLARRTELLLQLPESTYEAHQKFPDIVLELHDIQQQTSSGASAVVALIFNEKLYVANVGDCRALLCRTDEFGAISVLELNVRHDITNGTELLRLASLGLEPSAIAHLNHTTRCLGDFPRKGGYKDIDFLKNATSEPVIADAEAVGGIAINDSCRFLVLTTSSVCKALEDAKGSTDINRDLAALILKEFSIQSTINGVAQAVIDEISRQHYDAFLGDSSSTGSNDRSSLCTKREDMTLLIRKFNQPMATPSSNSIPPLFSLVGGTVETSSETILSQEAPDNWTLESTTSASLTFDIRRQEQQLPLDEDNRIAAYVDFSDFYESVRRMGIEAAEAKLRRQSSDTANDSNSS